MVDDTRFLRAYFQSNKLMMDLSETLELPVSVMVTFLGAAIWEEEDPMVSLEELAARTGQAPSTISSHLRYLGTRYRPGKPGMGLVFTATHPENARKKVFGLTAKGRAVVTQLRAHFENAAE